jgi:DNA-binding transcriptional MerR regulator
MRKMYFTPQEVAGMLGISKQTLIRYEKKRIFPLSKRNPVNKRREYAASDIDRLKQILHRV